MATVLSASVVAVRASAIGLSRHLLGLEHLTIGVGFCQCSQSAGVRA